MAEPVERAHPETQVVPPAVVVPALPALPRARVVAGERLIGATLRGGAILSGALFLASLLLELWPTNLAVSILMDHLRKAGASVLLVTPVVRLAVAGISLGLRGEWRYVLYAGAILALMGVAVTAGFSA